MTQNQKSIIKCKIMPQNTLKIAKNALKEKKKAKNCKCHQNPGFSYQKLSTV
jgi:hypothetical protein